MSRTYLFAAKSQLYTGMAAGELGRDGTIIGPRTTEQLDENLRALEISLSEETLSKLDEIFPGPGGAAPEAYAW